MALTTSDCVPFRPSTGRMCSCDTCGQPAVWCTCGMSDSSSSSSVDHATEARYWGVDESPIGGVVLPPLPLGAHAGNDDGLGGNFDDSSIYDDYSLGNEMMSSAAAHHQGVRDPTAWTIFQRNGPNHLGLW